MLRTWVLLLLFGCPSIESPGDDDDVVNDDDDAADDDDVTFDDDDDVTTDDDDVTQDDDDATSSKDCESPFDGIDRFSEEAAERGLGGPLDGPGPDDLPIFYGQGGRTVLEDLDGDGDLDLIFGGWLHPLRVLRNDGTGHFEEVLGSVALPDGIDRVQAIAVADLDGDGLVELGFSEAGKAYVYRGGPDLIFGEPVRFAAQRDDEAFEVAMLDFGDADGDGDLDILAVTSGGTDQQEPFDRLYLQDEDAFDDPVLLGAGLRNLVGCFIDHDRDGALDVFSITDSSQPSELLRNLGDGSFEDVAAETGADVMLAAMGFDTADLNGDGRLDMCITDIGVPVCLLSFGDTDYFEGGAALGLTLLDPFDTPPPTVGWGFDFVDVNNDGWVEAIQASGPQPEEDPSTQVEHPDIPAAFWLGSEAGFVAVTAEIGFGDVSNNLSAVAGDVDGDGWLDIVRAGASVAPSLWMNRCGEAHWLEVELRGPAGNRQGFGAQVVLVGDPGQVRNIHGGRGPQQGPTRAHFGLGDAEQAEIEVRWIGGAVSTVTVDAVDRVIEVPHPDA